MLISLAACVTGFLLDFVFGDPVWLYHPVRVIGNFISFGERKLRGIFGKKEKGELAAGTVLWFLTAGFSFVIPFLVLWGAQRVHPALRFLIESFWCYQILAARCLVEESGKVYDRLKEKDLPGARKAVSMIVGRDTENLTEEGVTKAAVETVAENTSDGVTAPLLFLILGGAPFGFLYKAVNTMDSMLGYKNEKYLYFGRFPAKMDDVFNFIPSRVTALFMIAAAFLTGMDGKNAWKIWRRDRRKHASPNSAQTESACAGALVCGWRETRSISENCIRKSIWETRSAHRAGGYPAGGKADVCDGISCAACIRCGKAGGVSVITRCLGKGV